MQPRPVLGDQLTNRPEKLPRFCYAIPVTILFMMNMVFDLPAAKFMLWQ
jgi:hypothetical protein